MTNHTSVEAQLLVILRKTGRVRPSRLVTEAVEETKSSRYDVREALRALVDRDEVALNWHGELEPSS